MWKRKKYIEVEMIPSEIVFLCEVGIFGHTKKTQIKGYQWINGKIVFNYEPYNLLEVKSIFSFEFFYEMQKLTAETNNDLLSDILQYLQEDLAEHDIFLRQRDMYGRIIDENYKEYPDEDSFLYSEDRVSVPKLDGESNSYGEKVVTLKELMLSIDEALDKGDKELFQKLSREYNKLKDNE